MINGYIITVTTDNNAIESAYKCIDSIEETGSAIEYEIFDATTPENLKNHMPYSPLVDTGKKIMWNWPIMSSDDGLDMKSGLYKFTYAANDQRKVAACSVSHARLWQKCVDINEPIMILESDALFIEQFNFKDVQNYTWGVLGLNDPRGATRKASVFYEKCLAYGGPGVYTVPKVDDESVPQGLAGNSAYIIRPAAASSLLKGINEYGLWPNDAYMCRQLWPWIKVTQPFYTKVQGLPSSTKG